MNHPDVLHRIAQIIYDKKGFNIMALDVKGISTIADYLVIAEGNVDRHVAAIARALIEQLSEEGVDLLHSEGLEAGDWVVLDFGGTTVHLFQPGLREKYSLERLWSKGEIIDLKIETEKQFL